MTKTYLFYDIETSGLNKAFDQVLQFAAIRTDNKLNELERHEIWVKLNPDLIPAPAAVITHRLNLAALQNGIVEIEAIKAIHDLLNTPNTISIGYNTLEFDDEFLRFSFYRNLLPPYTHQFANQCQRMDLYPMVLMYYLFKNIDIHWPVIEGKPSFKLERINEVNQFASGNAHNAMVDVEITLALARKLMQDQEAWDYLIGYFDKTIDLQRINKLPICFTSNYIEHRSAILIDGSCGSAAFFQCPVLSLGSHNHYKNQTLWLRLDKPELATTSLETVASIPWVIRKKIAEPGLLLPAVPRFMRHLDLERQEIVNANITWLKNNPEILQGIIQYHKEFKYPKIPNIDAEAALYENGFLNEQEQYLCHLFHTSEPAKKYTVVEQFNNPRLKELAIRLLGRHYVKYLPESMKLNYSQYKLAANPSDETNALIDYRGKKRLTPATALAEIEQLRATALLDSEQQSLLNELEQYILEKFTVNNICENANE